MRRRGGGAPPTPAQRVAWRLERNRKQSIREQEEARAAAAWYQESVLDIDQIEVPESFRKDPVMRLWYIAHCGPDGTFYRSNGPQDQPAFSAYHQPPLPPLRRRLRIARELIYLVLTRYAAFIWKMAGWRAVIQVIADASLGFLPAWGTFAQGRLVDAVQRSLYSKDVSSEEIIRLAISSIIASNMRYVITVILSRNNSRCQDIIVQESERINLQLNLDADMASYSNPAFATLLDDCRSISQSGSIPASGIPHIRALTELISTSANILSLLVLCLTTIKAFSSSRFNSPLSTLIFVLLAAFPTFFSDIMRRSGVYSPSEGYLAWQKSEHQAGLFYGIATNFAFKQEVLLFGLKDWILDSWTKAKQESLKHGAPRDDAVTVGITMSTIPENIVKDLLYMCLGLRLFSENITLGSLHVVQSSIGNVYWNITNAHRVIDSALVSIRCIAAFVGAPDWVQEQNAAATRTVEYRPKAPREGEKRGMRIEARDLSFRYPTGKENALRNINLTVEPGETLAIVGFNGGGKSTLAKVLTGLYEYEGSLLIDGVEARTYQRESLHKFMTVCPQNFAVFPLSIRENIGLGEVKDIDDVPAIMQAVKKGGAEEVIRVHGLDKHLSGIGAPVMDPWGPPEPPQPPQPKDVPQVKNGEKNIAKESGSRLEAEKNPIELSKDETESLSKEPRSNGKPIDGSPPSPMAPQQPSEVQPLMRDYPVSVALSGGQMQRVAISRSFMRADEATLVVLDEPSASLDARAEYELFQRIYALSKGESNDTRTTIYISHRFSTVRRADKIAVVEEGAITEFGAHKELMELNGRYAELFNLQVKAFSE